MDVSTYFLNSYKDGQYFDIDEMRAKSDSKKLLFVREDSTTRVYDDVDYVNVAALYAEACGNEGIYVMIQRGCENDSDRCFDVETSDCELMSSETVSAYDADGEILYSCSYLDLDENDIFMTSETVGREAALNMLALEIAGDEDVVRVDT